MPRARFRFYGQLNDLLAGPRRHVAFDHEFVGRPAVKDTIEAIGVPHPEVELVLVDGEPVGFGHRLEHGERVAVYPRFRSIALDGLTLAGGPGDGEARFVLDGHLGRLARGLRMLGFDSWYRTDADDDELAAVAGRDDRIVLTRDRGLLRRASVRRGAFVRSDRPQEQLAEVVERFDLASRSTPFGRCIRCNGLLDPVDKADILDRLEPLTRAHYVEFRRCRACAAIYWPGSHHARMQAVVESVLRPRTSR